MLLQDHDTIDPLTDNDHQDTDNGCTTSCHDELAECQDSGFFEREDGTSVEERFEQLEDTGLLRSVLDTTWTVDEDDGGDLDDSDVIETAEENEARLFQEFIASIGNSGQSNTGKKDRPQSLRSAVSTPVRKNWHGKTANQPLGKESTEDDGGPLT